MNEVNTQIFGGILVTSVDFFCYHASLLGAEGGRDQQPPDLFSKDIAKTLSSAYEKTFRHLNTKTLFDVKVDTFFVKSCRAIKELLESDIKPLVMIAQEAQEKYKRDARIQEVQDTLQDGKCLPFPKKYKKEFERFMDARDELREWSKTTKEVWTVFGEIEFDPSLLR